jgi:hypothetical protein
MAGQGSIRTSGISWIKPSAFSSDRAPGMKEGAVAFTAVGNVIDTLAPFGLFFCKVIGKR